MSNSLYGLTGVATTAAQYSNQVAPPADTIMINANRTARATSDALADVCMRLDNLKVRLFGNEPPPSEDKSGAIPTPQGAVYELGQEFDRHQSLVNRLMGIVTDLERLA